MRNNWLFSMDLDGGSPYNRPKGTFLSQGLGEHLCLQFSSFVDRSIAIHEAFNRISKFAGTLLFRLASGSNNNILHSFSGKTHGSKHGGFQSCLQAKHKLLGICSESISRAESSINLLFGKLAQSTVRHIWKELEQLQSFPVLSLASALMPPFDNLKVLVTPLENTNVLIEGHLNQTACVCGHQGSADLSFHDIKWNRPAIEPLTGIEFPTALGLKGGNKSTLNSEVLVGTGSRSMRIFKVKSLKVYAFGLYVRPDTICKRLGPKYASVPVGELNNQPEFFDDLLREDIHMTVRLVVNCNGLKISAVRDAFEKSLRARLLKTNPNTDFHCLRTFDSYFSQDISIPLGTTINFQRTVDGQLITEIGGKQMGAVHSKDLCRAFFGMYIGDIPVSSQAKEEIAKNVGSIIKRC